MSTKRTVPTFRVFMTKQIEAQTEVSYHGPIVSPNRFEVATSLSDVHDICFRFQGCLIYDRKWHLVNWAHIVEITKGSSQFSIPWPLREQNEQDKQSEQTDHLDLPERTVDPISN